MSASIMLSHTQARKLYDNIVKIHNQLGGDYDLLSLDVSIALHNYINMCSIYNMMFNGLSIDITDEFLWMSNFIDEYKENT